MKHSGLERHVRALCSYVINARLDLYKRGVIGPKIRQTSSVFFCFSRVLHVFLKVFGGFSYSQMAIVDSRTYCNTLLGIFGTSKHVTKYGPSDPLLVTEVFQKT